MSRLPIPMPFRFIMGLENTGKRPGITPWGPQESPWLAAILSLS